MGDAVKTILNIATLGLLDEGGGPSAPVPPTLGDVRQRDLADANRRRALARGGRASTILADDSQTPIGQQIPQSQIGRTTLLGG